MNWKYHILIVLLFTVCIAFFNLFFEEKEMKGVELSVGQPKKVFACEKQTTKYYLFEPKEDITTYELASIFRITGYKLCDYSGIANDFPEGVRRHFVEENVR